MMETGDELSRLWIGTENRRKIATILKQISTDPNADPVTRALGTQFVWEGREKKGTERSKTRRGVGGE
jgi:hypothetical protein